MGQASGAPMIQAHRLASSAGHSNAPYTQWNMQAAHSTVCEIIAARQSRLHHTNLRLHRSTARARNAPAAAGCIIICTERKTVATRRGTIASLKWGHRRRIIKWWSPRATSEVKEDEKKINEQLCHWKGENYPFFVFTVFRSLHFTVLNLYNKNKLHFQKGIFSEACQRKFFRELTFI